jgi:hypothetical protein
MRQHHNSIQHTFAPADNAIPTVFPFDLFDASPNRYQLSPEDSRGVCHKNWAPRLWFIGSELPVPIDATKISDSKYSILGNRKHLSWYVICTIANVTKENKPPVRRYFVPNILSRDRVTIDGVLDSWLEFTELVTTIYKSLSHTG